jgi:hypothetical protein
MDNNSLDTLLNDTRKRSYWLKPIGWPTDHPDCDAIETRNWTEPQIEIHFAKGPAKIALGDIIIAYRIRYKNLLYVAERLPVTEWTQAEKRSAYEMQRWPHHIKARNLAPEFAGAWKRFGFDPFSLKEEWNKIHPEDPVKLGSILRGNDRASIPRKFGELLIRLIRDAKLPVYPL